jgi:hypothetical protein
MPIVERTVFECSDGKQFEVLQDAQKHEERVTLYRELEGCTEIDWRDPSVWDVVDYLMENYDMTRKGGE